MNVIYESKGRAREYSELALNLYDSCPFSCLYCYAPLMLHRKKEDFHKTGKPRMTPADIEKSAAEWVKAHPDEKRPILLSFTSDPYQPIEVEWELTRAAIDILHAHGLKVTILTKGGLRATRDFDLLGPGDQFAVTLTFTDNADSERWEPGAALPGERIKSLEMAHSRGIETWVSLEPVIHPAQTACLVEMTMGYVDEYRLGMLNYHEHAKSIDWKEFGWDMKRILDHLGVKYMIKKDLLYAMGIKDAGGFAGPQSKKAIGDHVAGLVRR